MSKQQAKALWDYNPSESNELPFKAGNIINVINMHNSDWYEGELNGKRGLFPANRVEVIKGPAAPPVSTKPQLTGPAKVEAKVQQLDDQPRPMANKSFNNALAAELSNRSRASSSPTNVPSPMVRSQSPSEKLTSVAEKQSSPITAPQFKLPTPSARQSVSTAAPTGSTGSLNNDDQEVSLEPPLQSAVKKEGMLSRRADVAGGKSTMKANFKNVYAEIANQNLYLYKDTQAKKKDGKKDKPVFAIDLKGCRVDCSGALDKKHQVFCITYGNEGEFLMLQANSETEAQQWTDQILEIPGARQEAFVEKGVITKKDKKASSKNVNVSEESTDKEAAKTKLKGFFKNRPTADKLAQRGIIRQDVTFGGMLDLQVKAENKKVPGIVETCIKQVESRGFDSVGIYRLSGNSSSIQKFRMLFNEDPSKIDYTSEDWSDIAVITGSLKLYFRELLNPLLTFERYDACVAAGKITDQGQRVAAIKQIVKSLPASHADTLTYLIKHLQKVSKKAEINKMDTNNLAIVFGPTLIRAQNEGMEMVMNMSYVNCTMETIISCCDQIF